jgi:hypothetical protein
MELPQRLSFVDSSSVVERSVSRLLNSPRERRSYAA